MVSAIKAHWLAGINLDTNIDQVNAHTKAGFADIDAAKITWTGRRAEEYQFVNARIEFKNPSKNFPGHYIEVIAVFTR